MHLEVGSSPPPHYTRARILWITCPNAALRVDIIWCPLGVRDQSGRV